MSTTHYWSSHPAHVTHAHLATLVRDSGEYEVFLVSYKAHRDYEGGVYCEVYLDGEFQADLPATAITSVTNPGEAIVQFVDLLVLEAGHGNNCHPGL